MNEVSLVTLIGKPYTQSYKIGTYEFNDKSTPITQNIYALALFEHLWRNNTQVTDFVVIGSDESVWWQLCNCAWDMVQHLKPEDASTTNYAPVNQDTDQKEVFTRLTNMLLTFFNCKFIPIIYETTAIRQASEQVKLIKNIIKTYLPKTILLDITYGFRFVPWIVFTALKYKSSLHNVKLDELYYGKLTGKQDVYKSIKLDLSAKLFTEALELHSYQTTGDLTAISDLLPKNTQLAKDFSIANLAENFGRYDIARNKFITLKDQLIKAFSGSIAFNREFFEHRLNWLNASSKSSLIRLAEHFYNCSNYTDCILIAHAWAKENNIKQIRANAFWKLQNDFRTLIIHMVNKKKFAFNEEDFKKKLQNCLVDLTNIGDDCSFSVPSDSDVATKTSTLISVLGSGRYSETNYNSKDKDLNIKKTRFLGTSLAFALKKKDKQFKKLFICGTQTSKWNEFLDSLTKLCPNQSPALQQFIATQQQTMLNPNATSEFDKIFLSKEQERDINEQLRTFKAELGMNIEIYSYNDSLEDNGDFSSLLAWTELDWQNNNIYLDITHGYRSIPFIMFFAMLTICSRNNNTPKNVYYGYSEGGYNQNTTPNQGWLLDETYLLKLIRFSFDIKKFKDSGNLKFLKDILSDIFNSLEINILNFYWYGTQFS